MDSHVPKKTAGRCIIEIKKIEEKTRKQVTFFKRRQGLFKKAAELIIICGVDIAVFTKSPGGKIYTFSNSTATPPHHHIRRSLFAGMNDYSVQNLESEKGMKAESSNWWDSEIDDIHDLHELGFFAEALEDLEKRVSIEIEKKHWDCCCCCCSSSSSSSSKILPFNTQNFNSSTALPDPNQMMITPDFCYSYPPTVSSEILPLGSSTSGSGDFDLDFDMDFLLQELMELD